MDSFNHKTYVTLLSMSAELAKQYRIDCGLDGKSVETKPTISAPAKEEIGVTREDVEAKLKGAGIKFSHLSKTETLIQKAIENGLL